MPRNSVEVIETNCLAICPMNLDIDGSSFRTHHPTIPLTIIPTDCVMTGIRKHTDGHDFPPSQRSATRTATTRVHTFKRSQVYHMSNILFFSLSSPALPWGSAPYFHLENLAYQQRFYQHQASLPSLFQPSSSS